MNSQEALKKAFEDAKGDFASGYLGYIASHFLDQFKAEQAINETSAMDMAHIHSYLGKRALVIIKNAGLNEAALPLRNSCDLGANAGMVIVVTDDTFAEKSENKQDSRFYADVAKTLLLEPKSPSEVYKMTVEAFRLSEQHKLPVIIRITNALNNPLLMEDVERTTLENNCTREESKWILHPTTAARFATEHDKRYQQARDYAEQSPFNTIEGEGPRKAIRSQALNEKALEEYDSVLNIGTFPVPKKLVREFADENTTIVDDGEYLEEKIAQALAEELKTAKPGRIKEGKFPTSQDYSTLFALVKQQNPSIVIGDFGSYTLAPNSPIEYALHYGGAMSSAAGAWIAGQEKVYAIIGDGAFTHGLTGLTEAARKNANVKIIIIDNGGISGKESLNMDVEQVARNNGAYTKRIAHDKLNKEILDEMENYKGPSVLIVQYPKGG